MRRRWWIWEEVLIINYIIDKYYIGIIMLTSTLFYTFLILHSILLRLLQFLKLGNLFMERIILHYNLFNIT